MSVLAMLMAAAGIVSATPTVEYLVVAGGGSGSASSSTSPGGGGGAGGYRTATGYSVTAGTPIAVVVGVGALESSGQNSTFGSITSIGGGKGQGDSQAGASGGSGGGGGPNSPGGAGTLGQGYAGTAGPNVAFPGTGGGAGGSPSGSYVGGLGVSSSISGATITYAAGGGISETTTAAPNTGNGGEGYNAYYLHVGNPGNSGVVIIRYPDTYPAAASVTGSPTITVTGGYRIYKWTTVGTWSITF